MLPRNPNYTLLTAPKLTFLSKLLIRDLFGKSSFSLFSANIRFQSESSSSKSERAASFAGAIRLADPEWCSRSACSWRCTHGWPVCTRGCINGARRCAMVAWLLNAYENGRGLGDRRTCPCSRTDGYDGNDRRCSEEQMRIYEVKRRKTCSPSGVWNRIRRDKRRKGRWDEGERHSEEKIAMLLISLCVQTSSWTDFNNLSSVRTVWISLKHV